MSLTWAQFIAQDGRAQFGHYVHITAENCESPAMGASVMRLLAESLAEGAWRRGYFPRTDDFAVMATPPNEDVLNAGHVAVAAKTFHDLQASPLQFIAYCEQAVRDLEAERTALERERNELRTWRGFLAAQWQRWRQRNEEADYG